MTPIAGQDYLSQSLALRLNIKHFKEWRDKADFIYLIWNVISGKQLKPLISWMQNDVHARCFFPTCHGKHCHLLIRQWRAGWGELKPLTFGRESKRFFFFRYLQVRSLFLYLKEKAMIDQPLRVFKIKTGQADEKYFQKHTNLYQWLQISPFMQNNDGRQRRSMLCLMKKGEDTPDYKLEHVESFCMENMA